MCDHSSLFDESHGLRPHIPWIRVGICLLILGFVTCGCKDATPEKSAAQVTGVRRPVQTVTKSLSELRAESPTHLLQNRPASVPSLIESPPQGVRETVYVSGDLQLSAWYATPQNSGGKYPAVVYFHSGNSLGREDFLDAHTFLDAGFALMMPRLRGEDGNAGSSEMLWGEWDDAIAAVDWMSNQPEIDVAHIYTFGHSLGGGLSSLLALADDDVPIRHGASCGGLYPAEIFSEWGDACPFDASDKIECALRSLLPHRKQMKRPHYAFLGLADPLWDSAPEADGRLHTIGLLGDHISSLKPAIRNYATQIHREVFGDDAPLPQSLQLIPWQHADPVDTESVIDGLPKPVVWNVEPDPLPYPLEHFPEEIRHPIMIVNEHAVKDHGDVVFPHSPAPRMLITLHQEVAAPKGRQFLIDLTSLRVTPDSLAAEFETLEYKLHDVKGRYDSAFYHWPPENINTQKTVGRFGTIVNGVYCVSPGGRYAAAFEESGHLVVADLQSGQVVGKTMLPKFDVAAAPRLFVVELGFSANGEEFAAVMTFDRDPWLINWHWESAAITACHHFQSHAYKGQRDAARQQRMQLQFLEDNQGWLTEFGHVIVDRKQGERHAANPGPGHSGPILGRSAPRILAGNRLLGIWQDPNRLFGHEIRTFELLLPD